MSLFPKPPSYFSIATKRTPPNRQILGEHPESQMNFLRQRNREVKVNWIFWKLLKFSKIFIIRKTGIFPITLKFALLHYPLKGTKVHCETFLPQMVRNGVTGERATATLWHLGAVSLLIFLLIANKLQRIAKQSIMQCSRVNGFLSAAALT